MNMKEIREIAKSQGVKPGKLPKTELIRAIQLEEGNYDCFATDYITSCNQLACLWREDCQKQTSTKAA